MRNSFVNNNSHVLSQYYNQNFLNQQNNGNDQPQTLKPNFIIPKSSSMFIESIKNHQNLLSNNLNTQVNQPMSLDSYQFQQQSSLKNDPKLKASSVRTANIVNCTNNGSQKQPNVCLPTSSLKSIKPMLSPPPTPSMPQKNKLQMYPNVNNNSNNHQPHIINHASDDDSGIIVNQSSPSNTTSELSSQQKQQRQSNKGNESPDYETVYSGTFCRLLPLPETAPNTKSTSSSTTPTAACSPSVPMTPTLQKLSAAINSNNSVIKLKSVLKKKQNNLATGSKVSANTKSGDNNLVNNSGYDFHRAIEKLVEKMDLQLLDTSSESGYGSDQDSLTSNNSSSVTSSSPSANPASAATGTPTITVVPKKSSVTASPSKPPSLPPRIATPSSGSSPLPRRQPPPIPSSISNQNSSGNKEVTKKRRVRFDSYVLFLQGLRERDLELVQTHVRDVCDAALATDEVVAEFLAAVIEGRESIVRELLAFGFSANTAADPTGMTPLHLAAAFNHLPLVRILLAHGASVFARAHSSGKVASELCSRQLPGYQACHAYLRCMEECLGVANGGKVYSTQPYRTTRCDELGLDGGDELVVIRKGDYNGSSWWWCRNQRGQQGYVLQDLLALNKKSNTHHNTNITSVG